MSGFLKETWAAIVADYRHTRAVWARARSRSAAISAIFKPAMLPSPPAPVRVGPPAEEKPMSILTQDLRGAGFGSVLDAIEAAESAGKTVLTAAEALAAPGGVTPENISAVAAAASTAASAAAAATTTASTAVATVTSNPAGAGMVLVADVVNFLGPIIAAALTKKAASAGTVSVSTLSTLVTDVQAVIAKL